MKSDFYSRYYARVEGKTARPFEVASLGYNRCAARSDYMNFQRKHPVDRRFSEKRGRTLKSLVLVHITAGHGVFRSAKSGEIPVPANSIFFVFPGENHFYRYDPEVGWDEEWLEIEPSAALPLLKAAGVTPESPLRSFHGIPAVSEAFQSLFDAAESNRALSDLVVGAAAHRVLVEALVAWQKGDVDTPSSRAVERMRQALVSDLRAEQTIAEIAQKAGLSVSRLRELFRRATGLSPKKFQMRSRLVRAGHLLRETTLPISVIAEQTGFESVFAFSHRFRKLLGFSPSEYRQRKTQAKRANHSAVFTFP